jgi:hypothetical protein
MRLPAELLNEIYKYALGGNDWRVHSSGPSHPHMLALLKVCRQIHAEAALLPYQPHKFYLYSVAEATHFLNHCLPAQAQEIRAIEIQMMFGKYWAGSQLISYQFDCLARFTGLKKIEVIDDDMGS